MTSDVMADLWPPFGLRVECGPLVMRAMRDTDFAEAIDVVRAGIHEPDRMPFAEPWTQARGSAVERGFMQHHWRQRSAISRTAWTLELGVWHDGTFVGVQEVATKNFLITRTGETGSWLGMEFQGRGTGTLMRQAMCVLCLDHLGFAEITSAAFADNPASLAVSRKVGYRLNGEHRRVRKDELTTEVQLVLRPVDLVRPPYDVQVTGVAAFRELIGLDQTDAT